MIKQVIISFLVIFHLGNLELKAQQLTKPFLLEGRINTDTIKLKVLLIGDSTFYPQGFSGLKPTIRNHTFTLSGKLSYPVGIQLISEDKRYLSGFFIICPGTQFLSISVDSNRKVPLVRNSAMNELTNEYQPAYKKNELKGKELTERWNELSKQYDTKVPDSIRVLYLAELKNSYQQHDSVMLSYVKSHPNSYVALWKLIELFQFGYEPIFQDIYNSFSKSVKQTPTGKLLGQRIKESGSLLGLSKVFPPIRVEDANGNRLPMAAWRQNKFTLIDFWYSNCAPCLAQFDDLKRVYQIYHNSGFEVIGISTDKLKYRSDWQRVISQRNLDWLQYWDVDGKEATRLEVFAFPTNFLLDGSGKIIAKNLNPIELMEFLKVHVKH